jgi:hypothetical protein
MRVLGRHELANIRSLGDVDERVVVDTTVNLAVHGMLTPPIEQLQPPTALPAGHEQPPATGANRNVVHRSVPRRGPAGVGT